MRIVHGNKSDIRKNRIVAADEDEGFDVPGADDMDAGFDEDMGNDEGLDDTLEGIADDIEDMQDDIDEIQEDDVNIEMENNIEGHYIAECDRCKGIFISAVSESDQVIESIKGKCPLCDKESEQFLRWIIKPVE